MTDQPEPTTAALYARVSSDRQDVDLSVAAQLRALRDYAEKNNYVVTREYIDEAESGRVADRPEFRKMLDAATADDAPFEQILVWKFSRFTRKREHAVAFKSLLRRRGVRVVSITEHADDSPTGKLMEAIIESVDEFYSANLAEEVTRGMREAASRGFWVSTYAPYGYKKVRVQDGAKERPKLELDPPADAVVRRIFEMTLAGKSVLDIVRVLNEEGIPTRNGGRWLKNTVHGMLTNESYAGTLVWGKRAKSKAPPVRVDGAGPGDREPSGVRAGAGTAQVPRAEDRPPPARLQPLPAERPRQVRELRQGAHRRGGEERQVHLLRLPVPHQDREGGLRHPSAQREALRGDDHRAAPRPRPHRVQHPRPRAHARRGDGRGGPRAAPEAGEPRGGAGRRAPADEPRLADRREHRPRHGRRLRPHQGAPRAPATPRGRRRRGARDARRAARAARQRGDRRGLRRGDERVPADERDHRDAVVRALLRQGHPGGARAGHDPLHDPNPARQPHRGWRRRRRGPVGPSYEYGTCWWRMRDSNPRSSP